MRTVLGMTVVRELPTDVLAGLYSGQYTLHGGVIRGSADTSEAGQIVRHVIVPQTSADGSVLGAVGFALRAAGLETLAVQALNLTSMALPFTPIAVGLGLVHAYQWYHQYASTTWALEIAQSTMLLSGLHLSVIHMEFNVLHRRLEQLKLKLDTIQRDVQVMKAILDRREHAELAAALDTLKNADVFEDPAFRTLRLGGALDTLAVLYQAYQHLFREAENPEQALVYEEYFSLIALARARCYAESMNTGWPIVALRKR